MHSDQFDIVLFPTLKSLFKSHLSDLMTSMDGDWPLVWKTQLDNNIKRCYPLISCLFPLKNKTRSSYERWIKVLKVLNQFKFRKGQMMLACLKFKSLQRRPTAVLRIYAHPQGYPFSHQRQAMIWISNSVNVMYPYDW